MLCVCVLSLLHNMSSCYCCLKSMFTMRQVVKCRRTVFPCPLSHRDDNKCRHPGEVGMCRIKDSEPGKRDRQKSRTLFPSFPLSLDLYLQRSGISSVQKDKQTEITSLSHLSPWNHSSETLAVREQAPGSSSPPRHKPLLSDFLAAPSQTHWMPQEERQRHSRKVD